ncbi:MAG: hypothetical protein A2901_08720 [Elusimicrobia bacterium RIFCSPLOWO2_01_FULL_54_10]|nr:MAG: hypothetical protein A2901_08720 [Elusimicrobia bacterium RIFCSPLOWO2_01_FULL_54_10]
MPSGTLVRTARVNSLHPSKEFLAASVSQIQGLNTGPETFKWLRERKPLERLGHSIYVYDITDDREAHEKMAEIYEGRGEAEKAQRERARAKILS